MNLQLPNEITEFVSKLVHRGRFKSEEAAVLEGLRLLMSQEKLRNAVQKGVEQLDNDQWVDEEAVFSDLDAEIDRIESLRRDG